VRGKTSILPCRPVHNKTFSTNILFVLVTQTRRSGREIQQWTGRQEGVKPLVPSSTVAIFVASVWLANSLRCHWGLCPPDSEARPTYDGVMRTAPLWQYYADVPPLWRFYADGPPLWWRYADCCTCLCCLLTRLRIYFFRCRLSTISSVLSLKINLFTVN